MKKQKLMLTILLWLFTGFISVLNVEAEKTIAEKNAYFEPLIKYNSIDVFVTVYRSKFSSPDSEFIITADGSIIEDGVMWCAVSRDIIQDFGLNFGDTIIYNNNKYAIHDLTHSRLKRTVDILIHDDSLYSENSTIFYK